MSDNRQRFFIHQQPVRGEITHLTQSLETIFAQRLYPQAIKMLLGEMLVASTLLASTLKIKGRISLQIQSQGALTWAMAECNHHGEIRGLVEFEAIAQFEQAKDSRVALAQLQQGVLFINIEPEHGERYQGIVPLEQQTLSGCLEDYFELSAQIATRMMLACDGEHAAGLLVQLLPRTEEEQLCFDEDLWNRLSILTSTLTPNELIHLPSEETLYRLYHEEEVQVVQSDSLSFGCTCSKQCCLETLSQLGFEEVNTLLQERNPIEMDCQFCNQHYYFHTEEVLAIFGQHLS